MAVKAAYEDVNPWLLKTPVSPHLAARADGVAIRHDRIAAAFARLAAASDLVLVEGFKREAIPKIEIFRRANAKQALHPHDPHIVAIAADCRFDTALPQFDLDDASGIADFVCTFNGLG